ncbi:hypothetical protein GQ53DRAFT_805414 [Thozetella sp. PMI_491]|nr:hypothetical protein GQ53DRAFT_805414 [Thozetella sp. PMI_491]
MGFTSGFTGGVTVTLSLAYLAVLAHRRNREAQSDILRAQSHVLNTFTRDPSAPSAAVPPPPLTRAELAAQQRANFVETAKDRWNAEIENAVRWAQTKDWEEVRESAEGAVSRVLGLASASDAATQVRSGTQATNEAAGSVTDGAKGLLAKGVEKAKVTVGLAEQKAEKAKEETKKGVAALLKDDGSTVQKALDQRYKKSDAMEKSVAEVLSERYKPIDARDNTRLRGL